MSKDGQKNASVSVEYKNGFSFKDGVFHSDQATFKVENLNDNNINAVNKFVGETAKGHLTQTQQSNQHGFRSKIMVFCLGFSMSLINPVHQSVENLQQELAATKSQVETIQAKIDRNEALLSKDFNSSNPSTLANNAKLKKILDINENGLYVMMEAEIYSQGKFSSNPLNDNNHNNFAHGVSQLTQKTNSDSSLFLEKGQTRNLSFDQIMAMANDLIQTSNFISSNGKTVYPNVNRSDNNEVWMCLNNPVPIEKNQCEPGDAMNENFTSPMSPKGFG